MGEVWLWETDTLGLWGRQACRGKNRARMLTPVFSVVLRVWAATFGWFFGGICLGFLLHLQTVAEIIVQMPWAVRGPAPQR